MKNKSVKIRLTTDMGRRFYLTIEYFRTRNWRNERMVDCFYLTENARWASPVPLKDARRWMREAKRSANYDGNVIEKGEYMIGGKPTTLKAAGLRCR